MGDKNYAGMSKDDLFEQAQNRGLTNIDENSTKEQIAEALKQNDQQQHQGSPVGSTTGR